MLLTKSVLILVVSSFFLSSQVVADELQDLKDQVATLEQRVAQLEKALEPVMAKAAAEQRKNEQIAMARQRMRQDRDRFSADELREIETLYQVANKKWGTQQAQDSLNQLVEKYGRANRTGCAILYLGQMSQGEKKLNYFKQAIKNHSDCAYGDGVRVGALARFYLAFEYHNTGKQDEAKKLFDELQENYPDAIDHRGKHLVAMLPK